MAEYKVLARHRISTRLLIRFQVRHLRTAKSFCLLRPRFSPDYNSTTLETMLANAAISMLYRPFPLIQELNLMILNLKSSRDITLFLLDLSAL